MVTDSSFIQLTLALLSSLMMLPLQLVCPLIGVVKGVFAQGFTSEVGLRTQAYYKHMSVDKGC